MTLHPRRLVAGALVTLTVGAGALVAAAPAASANTCITVLGKQFCLPDGTGGTGGSGSGSSGTGSGSGSGGVLGLPIPVSISGSTITIGGLPVSLGTGNLPVIGTLPVVPVTGSSNGFSFPTGQTSATFTPALLRNDATQVDAVITDPMAPLYADGESVTLTSPKGQAVTGTVTSASGSTIDATFALLSGSTLADAGSWTLTVSPTDPTAILSQLQTLLGQLLPTGGTLSLPQDQVSGIDVYGRTAMRLVASATKLTAGKSLTLSGLLAQLPTKNTAVTTLTGATVDIFAKGDTGPAKLLKAVTANANGQFSYSFKPAHNATYVAYYGGRKAAGGTTTGALTSYSSQFPRVQVTPVVKAHATKARSKHTKPLVVKGSVSPNAAGQRVTLVKLVGGKATKLGSAKVNGASKFSVKLAKLKAGKYRLAVELPAHTGNTAAKSATFAVRRT